MTGGGGGKDTKSLYGRVEEEEEEGALNSKSYEKIIAHSYPSC